MLIEAGRASDGRVSTNFGLAAFEVALTQQKVFEETLEELAARQEKAKAEHARKAAEEREQELHKKSDRLVDVVVGPETDSGTEATETSVDSDVRGTNVDVAV